MHRNTVVPHFGKCMPKIESVRFSLQQNKHIFTNNAKQKQQKDTDITTYPNKLFCDYCVIHIISLLQYRDNLICKELSCNLRISKIVN